MGTFAIIHPCTYHSHICIIFHLLWLAYFCICPFVFISSPITLTWILDFHHREHPPKAVPQTARPSPLSRVFFHFLLMRHEGDHLVEAAPRPH